MLNEAVSVPFVPGNTNVLSGINWRVIPATAVAAFIFSGFEKVNGPAARALAAMALISSLFYAGSKGKSPAENISSALGYSKDSGKNAVFGQVTNLPPGTKFPSGGTPLT